MNNHTPFYIARTKNAKLTDISEERVHWFVEQTQKVRGYVFSKSDSVSSVLDQLVLRDDQHLLNAALLLFGKKPQRFCPGATVKCSHYHGVSVTRPIPSQQTYEDTLFEQIDAAVDFVQSKLKRTVGGREEGPAAQVRMEIPSEAISEIIVNAVVHRDYNSTGSVQVTVFADRVEVINPGHLPAAITAADLAKEHLSIPVNPFLARPFFLAGYINMLGYGTLNVIDYCQKALLPSPTFEPMNNQFRVILWRDRFTTHVLDILGVSDRQRLAVNRVKELGKIVNAEYQQISGVTRKTASRDLDNLVSKGVLERRGEKRGSHYVLGDGLDINLKTNE
ncbi:MAG: hypothetical protein DRR42_09595 [Gammaproteobacteria bacterium]|nr:MAG: hypothetical protein DRR42_09595 [Gammaproteobacteria bacterium]